MPCKQRVGVRLPLGPLMTNDEIDDLIDEWHAGNSGKSLPEFLGMTDQEFKAWVENAPRKYPPHVQNEEDRERYNAILARIISEDDLELIATVPTQAWINTMNLRKWLEEKLG